MRPSSLDWMQYSEERDLFALVELKRSITFDPNSGHVIASQRKPAKAELYVHPAERYWSVSVYGRCLAEGEVDAGITPAATTVALKRKAAEGLALVLEDSARDLREAIGLTISAPRDTSSVLEGMNHEAA